MLERFCLSGMKSLYLESKIIKAANKCMAFFFKKILQTSFSHQGLLRFKQIPDPLNVKAELPVVYFAVCFIKTSLFASLSHFMHM